MKNSNLLLELISNLMLLLSYILLYGFARKYIIIVKATAKHNEKQP